VVSRTLIQELTRRVQWLETLCRNIRPLFNFDPPATHEEIRDASLQFVRKISGFSKPSKANEASFLAAVDEVAIASARLLKSLGTGSPPRNREVEAAKARARAAERFGPRVED
jgi:hypothetical protein